jgi:hypothetical protein
MYTKKLPQWPSKVAFQLQEKNLEKICVGEAIIGCCSKHRREQSNYCYDDRIKIKKK